MLEIVLDALNKSLRRASYCCDPGGVVTRALIAILACCPAFAQPAFEVTSIKPRPKERVGYALTRECKNDRFRAANEPLSWIIEWAYDLPEYRVAGLPDWTTTFQDSYDIDARAAGPVDENQCRVMVRSLLADRFKMKAHRETRDMPVYELVVAKKGPKLREVTEDTLDSKGVGINGAHELDANLQLPSGWPMSRLVNALSGRREVGRPVIDKTGLGGIYSFELTFSVKEGDDKPSIFTAVQEQLGLKLEPAKAPFEVLVVDHIERTSAN